MAYVPMEKLYNKKDDENQVSRYKLVLTAASRANELAQGSQPLVESGSNKVSTVAMQEIAASKVWYEQSKAKGKKA